jgi:oligopeptide transport system permease protein
MVSMAILVVIIIMCVFGPLISHYNYQTQNYKALDKVPSSAHWFGTDNLGRDLFSRLCMGGRVSLRIGFVGTLVELLIGCVYGGICGYFGGFIDTIMMRIVEIIASIPYTIIVILLVLVLPAGEATLIIALCITGWTGIARLIRGQVMQLKESEYVLAARALGSKPSRIIAKHLIPNTIGVILVYMSMDIPGFIFAEAFLSFLGLGIQSPKTSWGALIFAGQGQMTYHPHELIFPAIAISLTTLAFNLMGDGLRDALDPKLRQ